MKALVRTLQYLLSIAFVTSVVNLLFSSAFWIALLEAETTTRHELFDYLAALAGPTFKLIGSVEYLAFAVMLELILRLQRAMIQR